MLYIFKQQVKIGSSKSIIIIIINNIWTEMQSWFKWGSVKSWFRSFGFAITLKKYFEHV